MNEGWDICIKEGWDDISNECYGLGIEGVGVFTEGYGNFIEGWND